MHFDSCRARYTFTDVLLKTVCRELFFETTRTFLQRAFVPLDVSTCTRQLCVIFQNAGHKKNRKSRSGPCVLFDVGHLAKSGFCIMRLRAIRMD